MGNVEPASDNAVLSGKILTRCRLRADCNHPRLFRRLYQLLVYPMLVVVYHGADMILLKVS